MFTVAWPTYAVTILFILAFLVGAGVGNGYSSDLDRSKTEEMIEIQDDLEFERDQERNRANRLAKSALSTGERNHDLEQIEKRRQQREGITAQREGS